MTDEIMDRKEAAKFLKISIATLDRLIRDKKMVYSKTNGRVLFLKEDLLDWVKKNRVVKSQGE